MRLMSWAMSAVFGTVALTAICLVGCEDSNPVIADPPAVAPGPAAEQPAVEVDRKVDPIPAGQPEGDLAPKDVLPLIDHAFKSLDVIFALLAEYPNDCEKAVAELEAYMEKNGPAMQETFAALSAFESKLSPEQKKAMEKRLKERAQALSEKGTKFMLQFAQRCPDQMARFSAAMQKLAPRPPAQKPSTGGPR